MPKSSIASFTPSARSAFQAQQADLDVLHHHALGQLQREAAGDDPAVAQGVGDLVDELGALQLAWPTR